MTEEMLEPQSLSGGQQSGLEETNDELAMQYNPCPDGQSMWAEGLPQEILLKIFSIVVDKEGAIPFVYRAATVCRSWRSAASDSQLWLDVDLFQFRNTLSGVTLRWLVDHRLSRVTKLNLSCCVDLKSKDYMYLFGSCRQLQTLNLSYCKLTRTAIKALSFLPNLQNLNLTRALEMIEHAPTVLCPMLRRLGPRLRELNLSNNDIKGSDLILDAVMDNCPDLMVLDLSSCAFSSTLSLLNIERFQRCCPKLRVLRLNDTDLPAVEAEEEAMLASQGFPELEELNVSVMGRMYSHGTVVTYDDDFILRLLKNSPRLRHLDVSMCIDVSDNSLLTIPAQNLKNLHVARCFNTGIYTGILEIISKWKHSLENVDLSRNEFSYDCLNQALKLMGRYGTPLRSLNLARTRVSRKAIITLLTGCRQLMTLDLTSAKIDHPCCARKRYVGRKALNKLLNTLSLD